MTALLLRRFFRLQTRRPLVPLLFGIVLLLLGAKLSSHLELKTRYDQLLPDNQPSAVEFRRVLGQVSANALVSIVLEGDDRTALRAFGDALVPKLASIGKPHVADAADGVHQARAFLLPRAGLFAPLAKLAQLDEDLQARWDWEVGKEIGSNIGDEPPALSVDGIEREFVGDAARSAADRFPDGYYQSKDGKVLVVLVHTAAAPGDLQAAREALDHIQRAVRAEQRAGGWNAIRVSYAGDAVTGLSEYGAVKDDLVHTGVLGVSMVLAVVFLFFMRLRALLALGATVVFGIAWTFGLTQLVVGHLNVATGFLFSIIAGNGINFGIIYMARYFEERRRGRGPKRAAFTAHLKTSPSTLAAAVAAAAAYGSLACSEFRVFRQFAFIGAIGMMACWIAMASLLPALLIVSERLRPFSAGFQTLGQPRGLLERLRWFGLRYDAITLLVPFAPRTIVAVGSLLALLGSFALVSYVKADPMEYDMRRLQNDLGAARDMYRASALTSSVLGSELDSSMLIVTQRADQVEPLTRALWANRDAALPGEKPFEAVHTLQGFIPDDQERKIPLLMSVRKNLLRARRHLSDDDWRRISEVLPPADLKPYTMADLPEELARPFTERDGTRGRIVLVEPTAGASDSNLHYLLRWADSFRETRLPNGELVRGSGRAVIFADMLKAVGHDIPRAIALSLGLTLLTVLLVFRRGARALAVLASLFVGLAWMVLFMSALHVKINFFNFVALPITFGIGVDYAVNLVQRVESDPKGGVVGALRHTSGPIILCSLTTILGYSALIGSINRAIRGLGVLAVVGEVACLLSAVLLLPAGLLVATRLAASARRHELTPAPSRD